MSEKKTHLLREYMALCEGGVCQDLLNENEKMMIRNGQMILSGIFQRADAENGNKRIYPKHILEREVENYQKLIRENRAVGTLDHEDDSIVNLRNVSHMVLRLFWEGNDVMGTIKVLNTPHGQTLKSLIKDGVQLGISSRALGSVRETSRGTIVEEDLQLVAFDVVGDPSTQGAFLNLQESNVKDIKKVFTKADRIFRCLNDIVK